VNNNVQYVIRQSAGELIFTFKQGFDEELHSKDVSDFRFGILITITKATAIFAVTLDGKFRVRKSNDSEWAAARLPHSYPTATFCITPSRMQVEN
jgi:heme/copper-type cytochrome/quinol oxidase subunit 3